MNQSKADKDQLLKVGMMAETFHVRPSEYLLPDAVDLVRFAIDNLIWDLLSEHYARQQNNINP